MADEIRINASTWTAVLSRLEELERQVAELKSYEPFTHDEKTKLGGIESGAQANYVRQPIVSEEIG